MIERFPVELLTKDHLIRNFEMMVDRETGEAKLQRGTVTVNLTDIRPQDIDFAILVPYRIQ